MIRLKRIFAFLLLPAFLFGCASTDYSQLQLERPVRILVIPPDNQTPELLGTYTFLSTISKPLAEKGYYVYPVDVIDQYFKANGVAIAQEMNLVSMEKLNEQFSPDAVLYTRLDYFGQKFAIFSSVGLIKGEMRLVSAKTGKLLWKQPIQFSEQQQNSSGNPLADIVGAVIVQAVSGLTETKFFNLSSAANANAINNPASGLLEGPLISN
jgi:hypothetical protein